MRKPLVLLLALCFVVPLCGQFIISNTGSMRGTVTSVDIRNGLTAEWRFEDGSGDVLTDYSGNGHHGELGSASGADANDPDWAAQGLDFVAANSDRVRVPSFQSATGAWTFIIVAHLTSTDGADRTLFSQEDGTGTGRTWLQRNSANQVQSIIGGSALTMTSPTVSTGFHSFTASHSSGTVSLYLDGGSKVSGSRTAEAATGQHKFGVSKVNSVGHNGIVAWARMYNRQLSDSEVAEVHRWLKGKLAERSITLP